MQIKKYFESVVRGSDDIATNLYRAKFRSPYKFEAICIFDFFTPTPQKNGNDAHFSKQKT